MKKIAVVSYNIRCNFTNYGSALQSWALKESIKKLSNNNIEPILVDYCPDSHRDSDPLNPFKNMWDKDEKSLRNCELSMPAIKINYEKFEKFYNTQFNRTKKMYISDNFDQLKEDEKIDSYICGADTIFCVDEFGIDDVYYANKETMKNSYTFSYAASFGDSHFDETTYQKLNDRLKNFKAISIREKGMLDYIKRQVDVDVEKVLDPTLLLKKEDYKPIISKDKFDEKYLLLYARRGNEKMDNYAENLAKEKNLKIIKISLNALNRNRHIMRYDAGIEEFLSLVKNAEYVVTNSYHGMIFSVIFKKPFVIFSREQCDTKIEEVLEIIDLKNRLLINGNEIINDEIDYNKVYENIEKERIKSLQYLKRNLDNIIGE